MYLGGRVYIILSYIILTNPLLVMFGRGLLVLWPKFYTSGMEYTSGLSSDTNRNNSKPSQAKVAAHTFLSCVHSIHLGKRRLLLGLGGWWWT